MAFPRYDAPRWRATPDGLIVPSEMDHFTRQLDRWAQAAKRWADGVSGGVDPAVIAAMQADITTLQGQMAGLQLPEFATMGALPSAAANKSMIAYVEEGGLGLVVVSDGIAWKIITSIKAGLGVQVSFAAPQPVASGAVVTMTWTAQTYDPLNMWVAGANITIPYTGNWAFTYAVSLSAVVNARALGQVSVAGVPFRTQFYGDDAAVDSIVKRATAGNTVNVQVFQASGAPLNALNGTFEAFYLGP